MKVDKENRRPSSQSQPTSTANKSSASVPTNANSTPAFLEASPTFPAFTLHHPSQNLRWLTDTAAFQQALVVSHDEAMSRLTSYLARLESPPKDQAEVDSLERDWVVISKTYLQSWISVLKCLELVDLRRLYPNLPRFFKLVEGPKPRWPTEVIGEEARNCLVFVAFRILFPFIRAVCTAWAGASKRSEEFFTYKDTQPYSHFYIRKHRKFLRFLSTPYHETLGLLNIFTPYKSVRRRLAQDVIFCENLANGVFTSPEFEMLDIGRSFEEYSPVALYRMRSQFSTCTAALLDILSQNNTMVKQNRDSNVPMRMRFQLLVMKKHWLNLREPAKKTANKADEGERLKADPAVSWFWDLYVSLNAAFSKEKDSSSYPEGMQLLKKIRNRGIDFPDYCDGCQARIHQGEGRGCSRCKIARYCSRECQVRGWKDMGHKKYCVDATTVYKTEATLTEKK